MNFRTDLALEATEIHKNIKGVKVKENKRGKSAITELLIESDTAAKKIGKPKGRYITVTLPPITDYLHYNDERIQTLSNEIKKLIPKSGLILVVGLGNTEITPDALGPKAVDNVLATRHISRELAKSIGLGELRPVSVLTPGVLGKTGIEVSESLSGLIKGINPNCLIVIDALASRKLSRLGCTVQLSNSGIAPGAGVGNKRPTLDENTLGVPVISIGIPTVVDAESLAHDILEDYDKKSDKESQDNLKSLEKNMMVTPKEVDLLINRAALLIGMAINCALHPTFSPEELYSLIA